MNNENSIQSLNSLIQSEGGLHFSAYIVNHFNAPPIRIQLEEAIKVASEDIRPVLSREERKKFLRPLHALLTDPKTLSTIKGNIGIFRSSNFFRVLHVPVHVEEYATVASSFHVKPLLRWVQEDRAFRLLNVGEKISRLYLGTQHSLRHSDTFAVKRPGRLRSLASLSTLWQRRTHNRREENLRELLLWLEERLQKEASSFSPPLFIMGPQDAVTFLSHHLSYADVRIVSESAPRDLAKAVAKIRHSLRKEMDDFFNQRLSDFRAASALERTESDMQKIARAAEKGLIKRLLVAADVKLFGKLKKKSGDLIMHHADIDHEDEDLLDDIAQSVVRSGGEVLIAPLRKIPGHQAALAIYEPLNPKALRKSALYILAQNTGLKPALTGGLK